MVLNKQTLSLACVSAVIVLDIEGRRLFSKYYQQSVTGQLATSKEQRSFEKNLFEKTKKSPNGEIILFDGHVIVYKNSLDLLVYVVGSLEENELILSCVLSSFVEALSMVYRAQIEKRLILDAMDLAFLTLDETLEDGILLESDPSAIASRVTRTGKDDEFNLGAAGKIPIGDQTLTDALKTAKDSFVKSLLK